MLWLITLLKKWLQIKFYQIGMRTDSQNKSSFWISNQHPILYNIHICNLQMWAIRYSVWIEWHLFNWTLVRPDTCAKRGKIWWFILTLCSHLNLIKLYFQSFLLQCNKLEHLKLCIMSLFSIMLLSIVAFSTLALYSECRLCWV
jgi:hypothetical protein